MSLKEVIKDEIKWVGLGVLATLLILGFAYSSDLFSLSKTIPLLIIYAFTGWFMTLRWHDKFEWLEREIVGLMFAIILSGMLSYYLGILGLDIRYSTYLIPVLLSIIGIILAVTGDENTENNRTDFKQ